MTGKKRNDIPPIEERDWLTVQEVTEVLKKKGIIHREETENKHGVAKTVGIQQTRKYIRNQELKGKLYRGSKRFGYIINKKDLANFVEIKREELKKRYKSYLKKLEEGMED